MLTPLVLAALAAPQDLELLHVDGWGDPLGVAATPGGRSYVALGTHILLAEPGSVVPVPLDVGVVDACVVALDASSILVAIAGGTQGLVLFLHAEDGGFPFNLMRGGAEVLDRAEGLVCTAVHMHGDRLYATFGADDRSELRVYDLIIDWDQINTLEDLRSRFEGSEALDGLGARLSTTQIPGGPARALALDGDAVYVALCDDGVGRVVFDEHGAGTFEPGPDLDQLDLPESCQGPPGYVRDLAVASGHLVLAADGAGLLDVELDGSWGAAEVRQHPLFVRNRPVYAARVDAEGDDVVVGTNRAPAHVADGAPYVATGAFGCDMSIGAMPFDGTRGAGADLLAHFERKRRGLKMVQRRMLERPSGWRDLVLRDGRVTGLRLRYGLVHWTLESDKLQDRKVKRPWTFPAIDGVTSLVDRGLVLFGTDSDLGPVKGLARVERDRVRPTEEHKNVERLGLAPDAQWLSDDGTIEWFVGGYGDAWRLFRHDPKSAERFVSWTIPPPVDPDGERGGTYFNAHRSGEWLFLTRALSRYGLLLYSRSELERAARAAEPGSALEIAPRATLRTHPAEHPGPHYTWRVDSFVSDVRGVQHLDLLIAAGREANGQARSLHARMFPESETPSIRLAGVLTGSAVQGHAMGAALVERGDRAYAFVSGLGGTLDVFDLIDPVTSWSTGPNPFDGHVDALLDIEARERDDTVQLLVAAGRRGVLRFEFKDGTLTLMQELDTPGWCTGVHLFGEHRVLIGDQKAGLRLYAWD